MIKEIIHLIKENIGKCGSCDRRFVVWEYNWDGVPELNLCKGCTKEKDRKEEEEYKQNFEQAKRLGKQVLSDTNKLAGWCYLDTFYENPDFEPVFKSDIDDYIRQEKKKGVKQFQWIPSEFEALKAFITQNGFEQVWDKKEFDFMEVKHSLKI